MAGNDQAASIQACALRITRLAADGTTPAGAAGTLVTNSFISVEASVQIEEGDETTLKNACGGIAVSYKDADQYKRMDLTITLADPNVEFTELTTGGTLITSGGANIGYAMPAVGAISNNGACVEVWTKAWSGSGAPPAKTFTDFVTTSSSTTLTSASANFSQVDVGLSVTGTGIPGSTTIASVTNATTAVMSAAATASATGVSVTIGRPGIYWRHVWPKFTGRLDDFTLENAPLQQGIVGQAIENASIGNGPANDFPSTAPIGRMYMRFRDTALPSLTTLGFQSTPTQV